MLDGVEGVDAGIGEGGCALAVPLLVALHRSLVLHHISLGDLFCEVKHIDTRSIFL